MIVTKLIKITRKIMQISTTIILLLLTTKQIIILIIMVMSVEIKSFDWNAF